MIVFDNSNLIFLSSLGIYVNEGKIRSAFARLI